MRDSILNFQSQFTKGVSSAQSVKLDRPYRRTICCGMGGSAIAGEILSLLKDDVIIHWDYDLPSNTEPNDLVICTSWSGNTEETISSYQRAVELKLRPVCITTGGKLADLATENKTPLIIIPSSGEQPRTGVGYMTGALLSVLNLQQQLPASLDMQALENQGKELAGKLGAKNPVIYSTYPWRRLTGFWKMSVSESAKRHVWVNWLPSGAHNEIVGWEQDLQNQLALIVFRDADESPRYASSFDALLALLSQKEYTVITVKLSGNTLLGKVFNNYILALWTGYFLAQKAGIDPAATELLDEYKVLKSKI